jgi:putative tryptophan/tyrosine transport system substrate-binding protein
MPHRHAKSMPPLRLSFSRAAAHYLSVAASLLTPGVPAIGGIREFVLAGGLMSYGASDSHAYRRAGSHYVASILRGTKPGDLPVEMPTKYELVISVVAAKALGLDVPAKVLARADKVIE